MNVRFAEPCRDKPLSLSGVEGDIEVANIQDGRTKKELCLTCEKDIYLGVFFDGTNNNKYRDTPNFSHSNVARLYEVYPGTPAAQTTPKFISRINPDGSKTERAVFPDKAFKASSVPPEDYPYYRKIYVPGLGTPLSDVGDSGTGMHKTGGLAMALMGQVRLDWAMLQLLNQVHAAVFKEELVKTIDLAKVLQQGKPKDEAKWRGLDLLGLAVQPLAAFQEQFDKQWKKFETQTGSYDQDLFKDVLANYEQRLARALALRGNNKPTLRKIRLSVFGFSRGAAAARAWANMVSERWSSSGVARASGFNGVPLQIDFLGIFDTVASVGLAQSTPHFNGHAAWADDQFMPVPGTVKRCAHLVAALEQRGSFPLDSVCQDNVLPSNCKEIVYPGVHSDVGGGYPPDDQGRALGQGASGDKFKPSQISLAQMYREARMAGVPLAPESAMLDYQKTNFAIAPQLKEDFNRYVAATRSGTLTPTAGSGNARFASMFPTETQPRDELHRIVRRHAGYLLRWRKAVMTRPGGMAGLPGLKATKSGSRFQDTEDFRGAEEELRKEIAFLRDPDPKKFDKLDDTFFEFALTAGNSAGGALPVAFGIGPVSSTLAALALAATWGAKGSLRELMRDKQHQWDSWLQEEWDRNSPDALPVDVGPFFERYVHDSRAWFKPFMRSDGKGAVPKMVADDETWFVFGGREKEKAERTAQLNQDIAKHQQSGGDKKALAECQQELQQLQKEGQPLMVGGREPYRMWGYVRHRRLYQTGQLDANSYQSLQQSLEREERERERLAQRERLVAQENKRHKEAVDRLLTKNREVIMANQIPQSRQDEFTAGTKLQIEQENRKHVEMLEYIEKQTGAKG